MVLLILLSLIISTRLIWLQLDHRNPLITNEFYASSLYFKRELSPLCPDGVDPSFPYPQTTGYQSLDPQATVSPGTVLGLLLVCQGERLRLDSVAAFAPHLTTMTAFLTALSLRLVTSNWVAGILAAAVVLSRGSIAQGPHLTGTYLLLHPAITLTMVIAALWARSRDARLIPMLTAAMVVCVFIAPLFGLIACPLLCLLGVHIFLTSQQSHVGLHRYRLPLFAIMLAMFVIPALIWVLHLKIPMATSGTGTFIRQITRMIHAPGSLMLLIGAAIAEMESQDFHWQVSLAMIALAVTFRRRLPDGSGLWAGMLLLMAVMALLIDGAIIAEAARQSHEASLIHFYHMREAVFSLEPMIIGAGVGYGWMAVRKLIITLRPSYSDRHLGRDRI